ncbi:hypothetical protein [Sphingomonas sp. Leaf205]|uniref:hypothetical protein n=1 Tax=Sphingomonas sp. Leaf205 TaxID=2876551 RepID=UPI001E3E5B4E|nr:hypothetical protein [Sphingomonas sp. Leaf205]
MRLKEGKSKSVRDQRPHRLTFPTTARPKCPPAVLRTLSQKVEDAHHDFVNRAVGMWRDLAVGTRAVVQQKRLRAVVKPSRRDDGDPTQLQQLRVASLFVKRTPKKIPGAG